MKYPSVISTTCLTIIAAAFTVLTTVHPVAASLPSGEINGVVRDLHGQPVEAVKISLTNWFGKISASAVTDDHGMYRIENITPGRYYVHIRPLGGSARGQFLVITIPPHHLGMNLTLLRNIPALAVAGSSFSTD
jgi:hypothetical protein